MRAVERDQLAVRVSAPARRTSRFIFASPHSGSQYPMDFLARSILPMKLLRRSEDAFVDELFAPAPDMGAVLIAAQFPRAYLDPNRARHELDPIMFEDKLPAEAWRPSPRAAAGLGVVPRLAADGRAIYAGRLPYSEARLRLQACYEPYHRVLGEEISATRQAFGEAVLIDCHSMPTASARGADIVLGDRFGASCARGLVARAEAGFRRLGFTVARNRPYAGGHTTEHYGRPDAGVNVLQVEISRGLYMDEASIRPNARFHALQEAMREWMIRLTGAEPAEHAAAE